MSNLNKKAPHTSASTLFFDEEEEEEAELSDLASEKRLLILFICIRQETRSRMNMSLTTLGELQSQKLSMLFSRLSNNE